MTTSPPTFPIIDSHIHLFPASHLPTLKWTADLPQTHPLNRGYTIQDYKSATTQLANLTGFIFLETDRKSAMPPENWDHALDEVAFLARIALGTPRPDEGHLAADSKLLQGIVPWAPLPAGPAQLQIYIQRALTLLLTDQRHLIKGFRYLLQDKPFTTMLQPDFIDSLIWLGEHDFSFDLGVDARSVGMHMLEETCELFDILKKRRSTTRVIVNHCCKPNLRLSLAEVVGGHAEFIGWKTYVERMAGYEGAYMKLSGFFSELPPQTEHDLADVSVLVEYLQPWVEVVFRSFTPARIMYGSDWPVCNAGGPSIQHSWRHWTNIVSAMLDRQGLTDEEKLMVWSGTAAKAYTIPAPSP